MMASWKTIRVFISSTFRDMQAERDWLVRFVFPKLREELLKWRVHLEEVDLRWGVTTDQDAFDLCMTEIDNCHPRFISMLGGRYGWVPPPREIAADFLASVLSGATGAGELAPLEKEALHALYDPAEDAREHRLKAKPRTRHEFEVFQTQSEIAVRVLQRAGLEAAKRSITASEIHYGALDRLQIPAFRYFYFRTDSVTDAIPEHFANDYREPPGSPAVHYLVEIKALIKDPATRSRVLIAPGCEEERPLTFHEYPCEWDTATSRIVDLNEFGDLVYGDLLASVKAQFGDVPEQKEAQTDEEKFAEEAEQMNAFIAERTERYVTGSREPLLQDMLAFATTDTTPNIFVLTGDPGSGKSALIGKFTRVLAALHPSSFILPTFVGASTGSTDLRGTLRRLCHELARIADNTEPLPLDIQDFIAHFQKLLTEAAGRRRVILVFDALNQFDATDGAHWLNWLPRELPPGVRIVASVIAPADGQPEHQALTILRALPGTRVVKLSELSWRDTVRIMRGYLRQRFSKHMDTAQKRALLAKPAARLPLYVLTALEELRTLGTYEEITVRIRTLPGDARALFGWILTERLARDPGFRDREGRPCGAALVEKFAACLGVSRHGLSPAELTALLDPGDPLGNVAALLRLLRPYLMRRGELLDFYHGQFRAAAESAYLDTPEKQRTAHQSVATCLQAFADPHRDGQCRDATPHALSELPHHQTRAQAWPDLIATLENLFFLEAKVTHGMALDLAEDFTATVDAMPPEHVERNRLRLLDEALRRDLPFIARHAKDYPLGLFQCLWNSCWWYDCPEAAEHYDPPRVGWDVAGPPWQRTGAKLHELMQTWRHDRERTGDFVWVRALRPPPTPLGGALGSISTGHSHWVRRVDDSPGDKGFGTWGGGSFPRDKGPILPGAELRHRYFGRTDTARTLFGVTSLSWSPDGRVLASGSRDKTVRLWDRDGRELACLRGHQDGLKLLSWSPDGGVFASASDDGMVRLWEEASGRELTCLRGHQWRVDALAWSPDGRLLASGGDDVWLWYRDSERELASLGHVNGVLALSWSPDGQVLASSSDDKKVRLWERDSGRELACFPGHDDFVTALSWSPVGRVLASGSRDKTVRLWERDRGRELACLPGHDRWEIALGWSPDGRVLASASNDCTMRLWERGSGRKLVFSIGRDHDVTALAWSPDSNILASGYFDGTIRLWERDSGRELGCLRGHEAEVWALAWSPDGSVLASGSDDNTVRLWDPEKSARELPTLRGHKETVVELRWSCDSFLGDGQILKSEELGSGTELGWDAATGRPITDPYEAYPPEDFSCGYNAGFEVYTCNDGEANFLPANSHTPVAWFPFGINLESIDGRTWAGCSGREIYLLRLEGMIPIAVGTVYDFATLRPATADCLHGKVALFRIKLDLDSRSTPEDDGIGYDCGSEDDDVARTVTLPTKPAEGVDVLTVEAVLVVFRHQVSGSFRGLTEYRLTEVKEMR